VLKAADNDDPGLAALDPGERSAISLGIALKADLILIDERRGYAAAVSKGLEATGTLGVLDLAARRKPIDVRNAVERLRQTNFRYRKRNPRTSASAAPGWVATQVAALKGPGMSGSIRGRIPAENMTDRI
jgi:hypothetical protein